MYIQCIFGYGTIMSAIVEALRCRFMGYLHLLTDGHLLRCSRKKRATSRRRPGSVLVLTDGDSYGLTEGIRNLTSCDGLHAGHL